MTEPMVAILMGSASDRDVMQGAADVLTEFGVSHEFRVVSAHRTPDDMLQFGRDAEGRGIKVIIAGAGGAAHLPGMLASVTALPVIGVVIGELAGARGGLGYLINNASQVFNMPQLFASVIVLATAGIVLTAAFQYLERVLVPWKA